VNISGATSASYSIASAAATDAGTYAVVATNSAAPSPATARLSPSTPRRPWRRRSRPSPQPDCNGRIVGHIFSRRQRHSGADVSVAERRGEHRRRHDVLVHHCGRGHGRRRNLHRGCDQLGRFRHQQRATLAVNAAPTTTTPPPANTIFNIPRNHPERSRKLDCGGFLDEHDPRNHVRQCCQHTGGTPNTAGNQDEGTSGAPPRSTSRHPWRSTAPETSTLRMPAMPPSAGSRRAAR